MRLALFKGRMRRIFLVLATAVLIGCDGFAGALGEGNQVPAVPDPLTPSIDELICSPTQGYAPLLVQCRIRASDKERQPVRCQVAIADGLAPVQLDDCSSAQTFEITLPTPAVYTLRAQAIDSDDLVALRTATIEVTERPNAVPVIAAFAAAPDNAVVPLATQLTWSASDSDGDPLTCEVDFGDDGTVDRTFTQSACTAGVLAHTVATAGSVVVLLRVKDGRGGTAERRVTLTARMVTGEVVLAGVEWMQTIVKENLKLVANKPAVLRVYVTADRTGLSSVRLDGEAFSGGASLGKLTFTGPASPPVTSSPATLGQQYLADVPAAMIQPGLEVRLFADADDAVAESDEANNRRTLNPSVGEANVFELTAVPVVHQGQTASTPNVEPIMTQVWPMSKVNTQTRAPYTYSGTLLATDGAAWADLLGEIAQLRQIDASRRQYYGWVRVGYGGGIAGIGYIGQPAATGRQDSLSTFAHEKGHNLGRPHAPCGGAASPDPNYPYAGGGIGSWGFNAVSRALINPGSGYKDLMSYCGPEWVSDYNYGKVQTFMETQPDVIAGTAPHQLSLLVAGAFRGGRWVLRPIHRVWAPPSPVEDGPLAVRLRTVDGREVTVPFAPWEVEPVDDATPGEVHFSMVVADPGPLAAVEVLSGELVLARRSGAPGLAALPQLERQADGSLEVTWGAVTHPSAAVAFLSDDGRTTLALDLRGGRAVVKTDGLPAAGVFEVSVSDGLNAWRRTVTLR